MGAAATAAAALAGLAAAGPAGAAFPGVNGAIALSRDDQIVVKAPGDLTGGTPLTGVGVNGDPAWSPDGLRIAFVSDRAGGTSDVWVMGADGSGQSRLTFEPGDASAPAWSPDGARIAYTTTVGGTQDVAVIAADGTGRLVVAGGPGDQSLPVWTPDGGRIVFQDDTVGGLAVVGGTGAGRTAFLSDASQPDFSPDGTRLVVRRTDVEALTVVDADGGGGTPVLTGVPGTRPAWSPDGTRIVYHRFVGGGVYRLFTVPAGGGGPEAPESALAGLDFSPDWQAIGPVPVVAAVSSPPSGAPGATLTVDGSGFVRRSVVRWNGSDRPTSWAGGTRLTASLTAADVAAPGTATVTVFTPPSGGGLSAPITVTIAAPPPAPPRILLSAARLTRVRWSRSRVRGALRLRGTVERAGRVEVSLARGGRVAQRRVLTLPAGAFARSLALAPALVPGRYGVRLREVGAAGTPLVEAAGAVRLAAPPEGVVATSFVSALQNGPPARTLRGKRRIFATFRFASPPARGRRLTTTWRRPGGAVVNSDGKPRRRVVTAFVSSRAVLPSGVWRCELRAGGTLVAVASVRLRQEARTPVGAMAPARSASEDAASRRMRPGDAGELVAREAG